MRRAQAAMEFLTTYGWAILVVLGAITALAYLGILNPEDWAGSRCTLTGDLHCADWAAGSDGKIFLELVAARDLTVTNFDVVIRDSSDGITSSDCVGVIVFNSAGLQMGSIIAGKEKLTGGQSHAFELNCQTGVTPATPTWSSDDRLDADVTVTYSLDGSNIKKTLTGELRRLTIS